MGATVAGVLCGVGGLVLFALALIYYIKDLVETKIYEATHALESRVSALAKSFIVHRDQIQEYRESIAGDLHTFRGHVDASIVRALTKSDNAFQLAGQASQAAKALAEFSPSSIKVQLAPVTLKFKAPTAKPVKKPAKPKPKK
jgi:hypothetical protein